MKLRIGLLASFLGLIFMSPAWAAGWKHHPDSEWKTEQIQLKQPRNSDNSSEDEGDLTVESEGASRSFRPCMTGTPGNLKLDFEDGSGLVKGAGGQRLDVSIPKATKDCDSPQAKGFTNRAELGRVDILFQGGAESDRQANITNAPDDPSNKVVQFELKRPNVAGKGRQPPKGRIQMNVYRNGDVKAVSMKVRMMLHEDFNLVRTYPQKIDWLTISEWWNNAGWTNERFPFRISVNVIKENGSPYAPLLFKAHAQTLDRAAEKWSGSVWESVNEKFALPIGRWIDLEYRFVEGNATTGRFYMSATVNGGKKQVIFDINNFTHHPKDPEPDGLADFNPIKLYTSSTLINHVRAQGGAMRIFWDDLQIKACSEEQAKSDSACMF